MKVLFLGSSKFSKIVLEKLLNSSHSVCAVITQPPRPSGRGHAVCKTVVHEFAQENNIPVFAFEKLSKNLQTIKDIDYDIALVASFGQILSEEFLQHKLCINVHPSLLPKYRGATPIQSAILNGDKETGVTIMKVVKEVDAGDIILQEKIALGEDVMFSQLERALAILGGEMAVKAIDLAQSGRIKYTKQDGEKAVLVKQLKKQDAFLDFSLSAMQVYNKFRALSECLGTFISLNGQALKVFDLKIVDFKGAPCQIIQNKKRFIIACNEGAIEILRLQSLTGKNVDAVSFLNGYKGNLYEVDKCLPT